MPDRLVRTASVPSPIGQGQGVEAELSDNAGTAMTEPLAVTDVGGLPPVSDSLGGRYHLERQLGRGGMGTVHLARDEVLHRRVAIKRLRDATMGGDLARQRLVHEARALAALNHPGVAAVHDVLDLSPPALVLEYVEGQTWEAWVDEGQSPDHVLRALTQVIDAVAYAHAQGVVHCDLKPSNLMVTRDGQPKVLDFGIALLGQYGPHSSADADETRLPAFTLKYAAPEVLRGRTPSPAADVYALGVMLEDLPTDCARAGRPLPSDVARRLRALGRRAQADGPEQRPRDGAALLRELPVPTLAAAVPVRRARMRTVATTVLLTGGAGIVAGLAFVGGPRVAAAGVPVVAVVPRVDASSSSTPSAAAADLLRNALGPLTRARLVSADVPSLTTDVDDLVTTLRAEGISYVLVPTVATMRSTARLSVAVLRASDGTVVHTATRYGDPAALARLVTGVAGDIRVWLGEAAAPRETGAVFEPSALSIGQYAQARQYAERADLAGNLGRAADLLRQTIAREPDFTAAHAELGRVLWLQYRATRDKADLDAAQVALLEALTRQSDLPETRITLALLMRERGRYAEAARALHDLLAIAPDDDVALRVLGELEAQQGSVDSGVALIDRAIQVRPGSWAHHRARGAALFTAGRYGEAARSFDVLTQLQPDNAWGFQMLGAARQMDGDLDGAVVPYRRSIALRPTASALSNLATVQYARGDVAAAARLYRQAIDLRPKDAVMHRNLGDALLRLGRRDEADRSYEQALALARGLVEVNASDARSMATASYVLARLARCGEAVPLAMRADALGTGAATVTANVVNTLAICDRLPQAVAAVERLRTQGVAPAQVLEADVVARLRPLAQLDLP